MRSMVEGLHRTTMESHQIDHASDIRQNLTSWNPQGAIALRGQPLVPSLVAALAEIVRLSIHLDRDPRLDTGKIQNIGARRMLTPELEPTGPLPKLVP